MTNKDKATPTATELLGKGEQLYKAGKLRAARTTLLKAIDVLKAEHDGRLPEAYLSLVWTHFGLSRQGKKSERPVHFAAAIATYEQAISSWRSTLAGNLVNLSAMYARAGNYETAAERAKEGMDIEATLPDTGDGERLAGWNHFAAYCIPLGRLDEAEAVLNRGLSLLAKDDPNRSFLLETLANVYEAQAAELRKQAEAVGANRVCGI